jgi:hypothetical protein
MKAARTKVKARAKAMQDKKTAKPPQKLGVMVAVDIPRHGIGVPHDKDENDDVADVEGGKARQRLDRPRKKAYASGGSVRGPSPSLHQASMGIDVNHPAYRHPPEGIADAPDVAAAKRMLHGPTANRLSDDDVKAIGDFIHQRTQRAGA